MQFKFSHICITKLTKNAAAKQRLPNEWIPSQSHWEINHKRKRSQFYSKMLRQIDVKFTLANCEQSPANDECSTCVANVLQMWFPFKRFVMPNTEQSWAKQIVEINYRASVIAECFEFHALHCQVGHRCLLRRFLVENPKCQNSTWVLHGRMCTVASAHSAVGSVTAKYLGFSWQCTNCSVFSLLNDASLEPSAEPKKYIRSTAVRLVGLSQTVFRLQTNLNIETKKRRWSWEKTKWKKASTTATTKTTASRIKNIIIIWSP